MERGSRSGRTELALLCLPGAIAVAILRHRLYDVDRILNRTLVFGGTALWPTYREG
jgi:hypothetical protein